MVKIFLAEDEIVIRNSIKNSIDWEKEGYEFVGEASDGELAYPLILKEKPDILLTDIKMPFMDGLELSEAVKKELPYIKIIILSGYNDFEYAQKAISIGVTDYVLKPISAEKLLETIRPVAEAVSQEAEERKNSHKYEEDMKENREYEKTNFLSRLLTENLTMTEILESGRKIGMDLSAPEYSLLLLKVEEVSGDEGSADMDVALEKVETFLAEQPRSFYFRMGIDGWAILYLGETPEDLRGKSFQLRRQMEQMREEDNSNIMYFGAESSVFTRLRNLREIYDETERLFSYRYLREWDQILTREDLVEEQGGEQGLDIATLKISNFDRETVHKFLRTGLKNDVLYFVEEYLESLGKDNIRSQLFRQYIVMDAYLNVISFLEDMGYSSEEIQDTCRDFQNIDEAFRNEEEVRTYLTQIITAAIDMRDSATQQRYNLMINEAKAYIDKNYDHEEISLNTVADSVNLSPGHFSTIFRQETGETFIEYLTSVRMEKARELLRSSSMKTSEIAYAVGYKDSHYFSYLFKKTQKCTPSEYRTQQ